MSRYGKYTCWKKQKCIDFFQQNILLETPLIPQFLAWQQTGVTTGLDCSAYKYNHLRFVLLWYIFVFCIQSLWSCCLNLKPACLDKSTVLTMSWKRPHNISPTALPPAATSGTKEHCGLGSVKECVLRTWVLSHMGICPCGKSVNVIICGRKRRAFQNACYEIKLLLRTA